MLAYDHLEEALRPLYHDALEALTTGLPRIPMEGEPETVNRVFRAILWDHPELFWFGGKWRLEQEFCRSFARPQYLVTGPARQAAREQIQYFATEARHLRDLPPRLRAQRLYDGLLNTVAYGLGDTGGQTVFDVFINGRALCKGLSKAYQLLLAEAGIPATLAEGTLDGTTRHVWNVLELDGQRLHADVSMGYPQFAYLFEAPLRHDPHRCLLVTEEQIRKTHQIFQGW